MSEVNITMHKCDRCSHMQDDPFFCKYSLIIKGHDGYPAINWKDVCKECEKIIEKTYRSLGIKNG